MQILHKEVIPFPKRVVVAGSSGCIGVCLISELKRLGFDVLEIPSSEFVENLQGVKADVFVNLAWRGSRGVLRSDYNLQLNSVKAALDYYGLACQMGCKRYFCPGTIGELMVDLPECSGIRSQNFVYINAKSVLRRMLKSLEFVDRCKVVWVRLGNVYGSGDSGNLVSWTLSKILSGERAIFGPAQQPYEFVHIDDCVRALVALISSDTITKDSYYIGCGNPKELRQWLVEIGRISGREELILIGERSDDGTRYRKEWFDISQLTADTGYEPLIVFSDGVERLISQYKEGV
jgi:nucleoside-diphosphate-sugar epimerase